MVDVQQIKTIRVESETLNTEKPMYFTVMDGGAEYTPRIYTSTSYSGSQSQFTITPPNVNIFVDRHIYLKMTFFVTLQQYYTTSAPNTALRYATAAEFQTYLNSNLSGPRQFPISSIIDNITVTINNATVSGQLNDYIHEIMRVNNYSKDRYLELGMSPSTPDCFQNYSDPLSGSLGLNRAPNGQFGIAAGDYAGRGSWQPEEITTITIGDNAAVGQARYEFTEPLFISPLLYGAIYETGLLGINNIDINVNYNSNLSNFFWSGDFTAGTAAGTGQIPTVTLSSQASGSSLVAPNLLVTFITPHLLKPLPSSIPYSYNAIERYITSGSTSTPLAAGASATTATNSITLNVIPDLIIVCVKQRKSDQTFHSPNTYATISNISVNWNNRTGLLSSASGEQLYEMSRKNGLNISFPEFSDFVGSPIIINPSMNFGGSDTEANGALGQWYLQMNVTYTNPTNERLGITGEARNYDVYIITCTQGIFTIVNDRAIQSLGVLSRQSILDSKVDPNNKIGVEDIERVTVSGGSILSKIGSMVKKALPIAQKVCEGVQKYAPIAEKVASKLEGRGDGLRRKRYVTRSSLM
jgi:hypothetical protein